MVTLRPAPPDLPPPGYCPALTWARSEGGIRGVLLSCAHGHEGILSPTHHTIANDGTVTPSVVCPIKGCTWHEFVRLDGWVP